MAVREEILIGSKADTRGFKKAESAAAKLGKALKNLAATAGLTFSAAAVINFGKQAVKAFEEAEKANIRLANVVDNLGLAFAQAEIQSNLDDISASAGIAGETLSQAFQTIISQTGSAVESQKLLALALDVSAGSGVDLATVAQDLAKAYVGQTRSLAKYNLGLTQGQLKTAKFAELQEKLNAQFGGSQAKFLDTYAGKMQILTEAAGNAQETIGRGLVDALGLLAGQGVNDIDKASEAMQGLAESTANVIRGQAVVLSNLGGIGNGAVGKIGNVVKTYFKEVLGIQALEDLGKASQPRPRAGRRFFGGAQANLFDSDRAAQERFQKNQKKFQDAALLAEKKRAAELKKQNALKKAGTIFDQDQIQIIAALKGKISADDRKRLELQLALATENLTEVQRLGKELLISQGLGEDLARFLTSLPSAKNPFEAWKDYLDGVEKQAARIASMQFQMGNFKYTVPTGNFTYGQGNPLNTDVFVDPRGAGAGGSTVVVNVAGSVTTSQNLIDEIRGGLNVAALSGSSANVERRIGGW
jgi:hypothetical protein